MSLGSIKASSTASDRIGAITLFALAVIYGIGATQITYAFSSDPLGPRVFPLMLAGTLALLSLLHFLAPGGAEPWPKGREMLGVIGIPLLVLASALVLEPLGFAVSMMVLVTGVARIFGASWRQSLVGGILQAAVWYLIFSYLLSVYLPSGDLFKF